MLLFDRGRLLRRISFSHQSCWPFGSFSSVSTEVANPEECAQLLRRIASTPSLPPQYWLTLHCLLRHFARVCQNGSKNLLSARALGEIFSPVFFRQQTSRWVPDQLDCASLLYCICYRRHTLRQQTYKSAGWVIKAHTLKHAHFRPTHIHTLTERTAVRHSWLSAAHTDIDWGFSTYQLCCAIKVAKPELPSDWNQSSRDSPGL